MINNYFKSESDLCFKDLDNERKLDNKRSSMDTIREHEFDEKSVLFLINLQQYLIKSYKEELVNMKTKLDQCSHNIESLKTCNDFNVNTLTDALIHQEEDKVHFKNAVLFMKNRYDIILSQMETI